MPGMSPAARAKAQVRIREWAALSPERRRMARNNYRLAKSLDRDERVATWESYRQMTPEQRSVLRANGWTSNTAARHAVSPTGLAKEAARPITVVRALADPWAGRVAAGTTAIGRAAPLSADPERAGEAPCSPSHAWAPSPRLCPLLRPCPRPPCQTPTPGADSCASPMKA